MAQRFLRSDAVPLALGHPIIGKNSEAFAPVDAVFIDANGWLTKVTVGSLVLGFANETKTETSDNQTVAKHKPQYVLGLPFVHIAIGSDQDAVQTDIGAYADYGTVTSAAQVLNLAAGASGQMCVLGFDPDSISDNDDVVVCVAEFQPFAYAQAT